MLPFYQHCGSVTFWYRYRSADPCHWLTDPDLDPAPDPDLDTALFVRMPTKNNFLLTYYFLKVHLHYSSKIERHKVTKQQKLRFFLLFLLDDGSIRIRTINDGSGSSRSKNIRIHNTDFYILYLYGLSDLETLWGGGGGGGGEVSWGGGCNSSDRKEDASVLYLNSFSHCTQYCTWCTVQYKACTKLNNSCIVQNCLSSAIFNIHALSLVSSSRKSVKG